MKTRKRLFWTAIAIAALAAGLFCWRARPAASGAPAAASGPALTKTAVSAEATAASPVFTLPARQTPTKRGTLPYVLTSPVAFDKPLRLKVEALGAKSVDLLSRNSLLIEADAATRSRLAADPRFSKLEELAPTLKVQAELAKLVSRGVESVEVSIVSLAAEDREAVRTCLEQGGGEMLTGCVNEGDTLRATLPADLVATLAARGDVRWLECFARPRFMNDLAVNDGQMNVREVWDTHGLTGVGQTVSTSDTGIDTGDLETLHEDLRNRVKGIKIVSNCKTSDTNGHGTHTAGSIVGDGTKSDGEIRGVAYGANLYAWFCYGADGCVYTPSSLSKLYTAGGEWDAHLHSASWGSGYNKIAEYNMCGRYTQTCVDNDRYVWNNPEFLPIYSAGNDGYNSSTGGTRGGSVATPASAKNVLAVGATQNARADHDGGWGNGDPTKTADFSSRGPCLDGRVKPDVAAPGVGILSTRSHGVSYSYGVKDEFYAYDSGTSMACPLTAGAVALVRQWLVEQKGFADEDGKRPTAALMKAVITGGAKGASVPNMNQGWGRVDLANTLFPTNGCAVKLVDRIPFEAGEAFEYVIETTNAAPLDVQLCWVDYPGSANTDQSLSKLVNDLDLTVEALDADDEPLLGNGGASADTLNNLESVRVASATPGRYLIKVNCKTILHDYTEGGAAALYVRGAFDPAAHPTGVDRVRIKREPEVTYTTLGRALANVQEGDVVEILDAVTLTKPVTIACDITLVATNADAAAAAITRDGEAALAVAAGARLTLSNVTFAASAVTPITVAAGGNVTLAGAVDLGTDLEHVAISTASSGGFTLAGSLTGKILLRCAAASLAGEQFGDYTCETSEAETSAAMIIAADDAERETRGSVRSEDGSLVWKIATVPVEEASGYFVVDGVTNAYARLERAVECLDDALRAGKEVSELIIQHDGSFARNLVIDRDFTVRGEGSVAITNLTEASFTVTNGSLTVENVAIDGYTGNGLFVVNGCGLILRDSTFENITGTNYHSGAVAVLKGTAVVERCIFNNCRVPAKKGMMCYGGAAYVNSGCELRLADVVMTNCYAASYGGAVYANGSSTAGALLTLAGANTVIRDNASGAGADDLYIVSTQVSFQVTSALGGTDAVGVRYGVNASEVNGVGGEFATLADDFTVEDIIHTEVAFFSDPLPELAAKATDGVLAWAEPTSDRRVDDVADAVVEVTDGNDQVNGYYGAFEDALWSLSTNGVGGATVSVLKPCFLSADAQIAKSLTIRSAAGAVNAVTRNAVAKLTVAAEAVVTLTDIEFAGGGQPGLLFEVRGGTLILDAGAYLHGIGGSESRCESAVWVGMGGTFRMVATSRIEDCRNTLERASDGTGCGGAVLIDAATAYLEGGTITGSLAYRYGGGFFAGNGSTVYLRGDLTLTGNENALGEKSNLTISDDSELILTGALTGQVGVYPAVLVETDSNVFARVENAALVADTVSLTNSARRFSNDVTGAYGVAMTNASETVLLVWSRAVKSDGSFVTGGDATYWVVGDIPINELPVSPTPIAFKSITVDSAGEKCTLVLTNLVRGCRYSLFATNSLVGGFETEGIEPVEKFAAEEDGEHTFVEDYDASRRFWKATAEDGVIYP